MRIRNNMASMTNSSDTSFVEAVPPAARQVVRQFQHDAAVLIGVLGVLLNGLVLLGFLTNNKILARTPQRIVTNQSLIDLTLSVFLIVSQFRSSYLSPYLPESGVGPSPAAYCHVLWSAYMVWALIDVSSYNLVLLTLERYVSVCHPFNHRDYCTGQLLVAFLTFVWIAGFSWAVFNIVFFKYIPSDRSCVWSADPLAFSLFVVGQTCLSLFFPLLLMIFSYFRMFGVLRTRVSTGNQEDDRKAAQSRSFIVTCMFTAVAYFICFSINNTWLFLSTLQLVSMDFSNVFYQFTVLMAFANCFVNPIIYIIRVAAFRRHLVQLLTNSLSKLTSSISQDVRSGVSINP